jgi:SAM-dependent methyltransferase
MSDDTGTPAGLDEQNAAFWDELCGTTMAKSVGVSGRTADDLRKFDDAYLSFYPYLTGYLPDDLAGKRVLEIGLGYGTLGGVLVDRGARYTGVDISPGPVAMMQHRIALADRAAECDAQQGSALALPFADGEFDLVCTIGCLHHTGDLPGAITEVRRVTKTGGTAVVMVYNRWSARRVVSAPRRALAARRDRNRAGAAARAQYDADQAGNAAPHTDFVSRGDLRKMLGGFSSVEIQKRNIDVARVPQARPVLLGAHVDRLVGLDLYARAVA